MDEASQAEQIKYYLGAGYTLEQLQKPPFNYKESTVRQEVDKVIVPQGDKQGGPTRLPVVLKAGAGQELISPEAIIQNYLVPDGEAGKWMLRGFMLYRAAQLAVMTDVEIMKGQSDAQAKALKPIMDIMEQARTDMDAAAQRAKDSNTEIAEMAAAGAAVRAVSHIDARFEELKAHKPDIASTPNPMQGMMARTMEMLMNQLMGQLMPGSQGGAIPGFVDKRTQGQQGGN